RANSCARSDGCTESVQEVLARRARDECGWNWCLKFPGGRPPMIGRPRETEVPYLPARFQILIVWSKLMEIRVLPSGLKTTNITTSVWPLSVASSLPVATSHNLIV